MLHNFLPKRADTTQILAPDDLTASSGSRTQRSQYENQNGGVRPSPKWRAAGDWVRGTMPEAAYMQSPASHTDLYETARAETAAEPGAEVHLNAGILRADEVEAMAARARLAFVPGRAEVAFDRWQDPVASPARSASSRMKRGTRPKPHAAPHERSGFQSVMAFLTPWRVRHP
jgi:hypothetical protein